MAPAGLLPAGRRRRLHVRGGRAPTDYAWADLLEVGWTRATGASHALPGLVVRPKGGPWDTPGPNAPRQVATVAVYDADGEERAVDVLERACRRHGVAFAPDGAAMLASAPPGSRWRTE